MHFDKLLFHDDYYFGSLLLLMFLLMGKVSRGFLTALCGLHGSVLDSCGRDAGVGGHGGEITLDT